MIPNVLNPERLLISKVLHSEASLLCMVIVKVHNSKNEKGFMNYSQNKLVFVVQGGKKTRSSVSVTRRSYEDPVSILEY